MSSVNKSVSAAKSSSSMSSAVAAELKKLKMPSLSVALMKPPAPKPKLTSAEKLTKILSSVTDLREEHSIKLKALNTKFKEAESKAVKKAVTILTQKPATPKKIATTTTAPKKL
jgi:hypothetical protein